MLVVSTSLLGVVLGGRVPTSFAEPATSPLTAQNQNRDDLQKQALAAFNARDFPLAARFLERLISAEPGDYVLREALGQCFVDGGGSRSARTKRLLRKPCGSTRRRCGWRGKRFRTEKTETKYF